jgi:prevent-host-death family protein
VKRISIQDLKAGLSAAVAETRAGATILITRHNEPVAQLGPVRPAHVRRGRRAGAAVAIEPALRCSGTNGRYLDVLAEDRGTR